MVTANGGVQSPVAAVLIPPLLCLIGSWVAFLRRRPIYGALGHPNGKRRLVPSGGPAAVQSDGTSHVICGPPALVYSRHECALASFVVLCPCPPAGLGGLLLLLLFEPWCLWAPQIKWGDVH